MMKMKLNDNLSLVKDILDKLKENKSKYGERYCPCKLERIEDNICICNEFLKRSIPGECYCGLYVKIDEEK